MRVFVAIDLSEEAKQGVLIASNIIKDNTVSCSLSPKTNFHITLAFLGEIEEERVSVIKECLDDSFDKPFDITIGGFGMFKRSFGDVVFRKVSFDKKNVTQILNFKKALSDKGFELDPDEFTAHVTISRKTVFVDDFSLDEQKLEPIPCHIDKITIFRSNMEANHKTWYSVIYQKELK